MYFCTVANLARKSLLSILTANGTLSATDFEHCTGVSCAHGDDQTTKAKAFLIRAACMGAAAAVAAVHSCREPRAHAATPAPESSVLIRVHTIWRRRPCRRSLRGASVVINCYISVLISAVSCAVRMNTTVVQFQKHRHISSSQAKKCLIISGLFSLQGMMSCRASTCTNLPMLLQILQQRGRSCSR